MQPCTIVMQPLHHAGTGTVCCTMPRKAHGAAFPSLPAGGGRTALLAVDVKVEILFGKLVVGSIFTQLGKSFVERRFQLGIIFT